LCTHTTLPSNNALTTAYRNGSIVYPRVENDYIISPYWRIVDAHAPLNTLDPFSSPLLEEEYPFTKATLPIALANMGISTPSTTLQIMKFIDTLYDDSLHPILEKREKIEDTLSRTFQHIEMITKDGWIKDGQGSDINMLSSLEQFIGDGVVAKKTRHYFIHSLELDPHTISIIKKAKPKKKARRDSKDNFIIDSLHERSFIHESLEHLIGTIKIRSLLLESESEKRTIVAKDKARRKTNIKMRAP